jgi:hypothetical protein
LRRSSARAQKPQSQEQLDRSDCGVDDEANDSSAEMKSKAMQEPVTDERPDDTQMSSRNSAVT